MVTILSENGAPTPVVWTRMRPPQSLIGAVDPAEVDRAGRGRPTLWPTYATELDRPSAREMLAAEDGRRPTPAPPRPGPRPPRRRLRRHRAPTSRPKPKRAPAKAKTPAKPKAKAKDADGNPVTDFLKSREGRATVNNVVRGVFDLIKKK